MSPDAKKYLYDIERAATRIVEFCGHSAWPDYRDSAMLQSAVERQFEIIGEALNQLSRRDPGTSGQITHCARIIAFRNILIHGYAELDARIVWGVIESHLPVLQDEVATLLRAP